MPLGSPRPAVSPRVSPSHRKRPGINHGDPVFAEIGDVDTSAAVLSFAGGVTGTVSSSRYNARGCDCRLEPTTPTPGRKPVESAQYVSVAPTAELLTAGIARSIGTVGDTYDCEDVGCRHAA